MRLTTAAAAGAVPAILMASLLAIAPALAQHPNRHDERALKEDPRLAPGQIAPVLEGLGEHHHEITTKSERAQMFFDQGLKLTYGFNHQEALRAFKEAARLDPGCAMAYWGWALVLGPNINLPMSPEVVPQAYEAIQKAVALREEVSAAERDYIDALAVRYTDDPEADRSTLDTAYAEAMQALARKYPHDPDAATLFAAALMNLSPWNYWTRDGRPRPTTEQVLATLERALEIDPQHEGALHYYIHIIEPVDPRRGERIADTLRGLAPGAGHLVHMPSHIYIQLGRYEEAVAVNEQAAEADEGYITQCRAQGIYPLNYYPHNLHFLAWAAMMQGRSAVALEASRKVASRVPEDMHGNTWALYQSFLSMPLFTLSRFGRWEEILQEPQPPAGATYWTGIWRYARGLAYAGTGEAKKARKELDALRKIADDPATPEVLIGFSTADTLLQIAVEMLAAEIAAADGRLDEAIPRLDRAVRLEDSLTYTEPPDWYHPPRHALGAMLLAAGRPREAEVVYWQDLEKNRDNGFALHGLHESLQAQGRDDDAAEVAARLRRAWAKADVTLASSRF